MRRATPLQVVIVRDRNDPLTEQFVDVIRQVFEGATPDAKPPSLYFSEAYRIGIPLLDPVIDKRPEYLQALLGGARTTIAVEVRSRGHRRWPARVHALLTAPSVVRIPVNVPEEVASGTIQLSVTQAGHVEPAFAPVVAALAALEVCRRELIRKVYGARQGEKKAKLFISHAKADGVAMAHAIVSLLNRIRSLRSTASMFKYFYDAESIQPGDKWRSVLKQHAKNCLFIALRTEEYESRYWCRQEYLWAERNRAPILVVDLRREMFSAASQLPLENADAARISDGNIIRVLFHALRCHVNFLQLRFRVNPTAGQVVLPRYPSSLSIEGALEEIEKAKRPGEIIYAGMTLPPERTSALLQQLQPKGVALQSEVEWEMANVY